MNYNYSTKNSTAEKANGMFLSGLTKMNDFEWLYSIDFLKNKLYRDKRWWFFTSLEQGRLH